MVTVCSGSSFKPGRVAFSSILLLLGQEDGSPLNVPTKKENQKYFTLTNEEQKHRWVKKDFSPVAHESHSLLCPLSSLRPSAFTRKEKAVKCRPAGTLRQLESIGRWSRSLGHSSSPTAQSCALSWTRHAWGVGWGRWPEMDGYQGAGCGQWVLPRAPTPP